LNKSSFLGHARVSLHNSMVRGAATITLKESGGGEAGPGRGHHPGQV